MFKLIVIFALAVVATCAPAEPAWNAAWADPRVAPAAASAATAPWNRWNNPAAVDPRWNRWGAAAPAAADPWNRWGAGAAAWNQQPWNRAGAAVAPAAAAAAGNRALYPW